MQDVQRVMQSEQAGMPTVQSMHPAQRFLNAGQVSQMLGIDRSTVYRMAEQRAITRDEDRPTVGGSRPNRWRLYSRHPVILLQTQRPADGRYCCLSRTRSHSSSSPRSSSAS